MAFSHSLAAVLALFTVSVLSHSHDSHDSHDHDDEHGSDHTCHYGFVSWTLSAIAEDHCGYETDESGTTYSYTFECIDDHSGYAIKYDGMGCDSSSMVEQLLINDTSMIDCSSTSDDCTLIEVYSDFFSLDDANCTGTDTGESRFTLTSGLGCVHNGAGLYYDYDVTLDIISIGIYTTDDCSGDPGSVLTVEDGCDHIGDRYVDYVLTEVEDEDDDSGAMGVMSVMKMLCFCGLVTLYSLYM